MIGHASGDGVTNINLSFETSSGFLAVRGSDGITTTYDQSLVPFVILASKSPLTFWSCVSLIDPTPDGFVKNIDLSSSGITFISISNLTDILTVVLTNNQLTQLSATSKMSFVDIGNNLLNSSAVDALLVSVNSFGTSSGFLSTISNSAPGPSGVAAKAALILRGWTVNTD